MKKTVVTSEKIKTHNFKFIEMWERAFNKEISQNQELRTFVEQTAKQIKR